MINHHFGDKRNGACKPIKSDKGEHIDLLLQVTCVSTLSLDETMINAFRIKE